MLACIDGDHIALDDGRLLRGDPTFSRFCPDLASLRRHVYGLGLGDRDVSRLVRRFQIRFPIARLVTLAGGSWPVLEVSWRDGWSIDKRRFGLRWSPRATWCPSQAERAAGSAIEGLLHHAAMHGWPGTRRGWWSTPEVPWERVSQLPMAGAGYRRRGEPIIATALFPGGLRAWWGGLNRRLDNVARRVVLTADFVYARFAMRTLRLPRNSLRASYEDGSFRVFVFGRCTPLVIERHDRLARALEAQLGNVRARS